MTCDDPLPDADMEEEEYGVELDLQPQAQDSLPGTAAASEAALPASAAASEAALPATAAAWEASGSTFMSANVTDLQQSLPSLLPEASSAAPASHNMSPVLFPGHSSSAAPGPAPIILQSYPAMQPGQHSDLGMPPIPTSHSSYHAAAPPFYTFPQGHASRAAPGPAPIMLQSYPAMQPAGQHTFPSMPPIRTSHSLFRAAPAPSYTSPQGHTQSLQSAYDFSHAATPQSQPLGQPGVQRGSHRGSKRKFRWCDPEVEKRQRLTPAWQSHSTLEAAVAAADGSGAATSTAQAEATGRTPRQNSQAEHTVQTAVTSTTAAATSQGLSAERTETGPVGAALEENVSVAGQAGASLGLSSTGDASRLAASSFSSTQVQAAVAKTAGGIQSTYKFSF